MKPIILKMKAFGSYGMETVIDFTKTTQNLFLITGDTGSGKSTIFDAIVFALYGQAGASDNAKGGLDLQSQYVGIDVEPYVELIFSEMRYGEEQLYRVCRKPQHLRNKRGGGTTDVKENVEIFRPDGSHDSSDVNQKQKNKNEINQELENIVGLTKEQFMQVAMIAQGDFTRLIKANTNERKPIFRKIFNTGIYEKIISVLSAKYKDLSDKNELIKSDMQREVSKISLPEDFPHNSEVEACKNKLVSDNKWSTVDMEEMLGYLKQLCEFLSEQNKTTETKRKDTEKKRDKAREEFTKAQTLITSFKQLEEAEKILVECEKRTNEINQKEKLKNDINKAYGISDKYNQLDKADKALKKYNNDLKKLKEDLPEQIKIETEALNKKNHFNEDFMKKNDQFSRIEDSVNKELKLFEDIKNAISEEKKCHKSLKTATEEKENAKKASSEFENQLKEWKEEQKKLSECGVLLEKVNSVLDKIKDAETHLIAAEKAEKDIKIQKETAEQAQNEYKKARDAFDEKNSNYLENRKAYYDAQAGILAKELEDGKPCPVCGSLSHPTPCKLKSEHKDISQEYIAQIEQEVQNLDKEQQELSIKASNANNSFKEKESQANEKLQLLAKSLLRADIEFTEPLNLKLIKKALNVRLHKTEESKAALTKDMNRYKELSDLIENSTEKLQKLEQQYNEADKKYNEANKLYITARTSREGIEKQKTYATEEEANEKLSQAKKSLNESERLYNSAEKAYGSEKSKREQTETKIDTLKKQTIPLQENETEESRKIYIEIMKNAKMTENEWKSIVSGHKFEEQTELNKELKEYSDTVTRANSQKNTAKAAVGDKSKPNIESLEKEKKLWETSYKEVDELYQKNSAIIRENSEVYKYLTSKFTEQKEQLLKFNRVKNLRDKLAGKEAGEKTDIETVVQRMYLERIIEAANRRFLEMSSDQFEFRMMDISKSSSKDRGLELMVRSTVTGKEQEVKMLSGGESFIAALSLALGMSDQIQQNSAFVNLDIMFIDEGFGSLDANTRNQAIRVLKNMADGSKMIGIISHVSELQQQIDDKLVVERDRSGSNAHWIIS